jgi:hypothetical protein
MDRMTTTEQPLNLYVVARGDEVDYDETAAYVVAATSAADARRAGESVSGIQSDSIWWAPETAVTLIGVAGPDVDPGIVIADYHAG